jgi:hypothetical protein
LEVDSAIVFFESIIWVATVKKKLMNNFFYQQDVLLRQTSIQTLSALIADGDATAFTVGLVAFPMTGPFHRSSRQASDLQDPLVCRKTR